MFGVVTTVAVIALGQLVSRPSTQDDGWQPALSDPTLHQMVRIPTDGLIMPIESSRRTTETNSFSTNDRGVSRLDHLREELLSYRSLPTGWDGAESLTPDSEHIDAASSLLDVLPAGIPLPKPMLSPDGEIGLYWKDKRWLADAVIEDKNHFSLFIRSLEQGHSEVLIDSIVIGPGASNAIKTAFASV